MFQDEVVQRRKWLTQEEFLDLLGAVNLIPGPNSTEMAIHIGHRRAGWPGLIVAGCCFILPATLIVTAFAWAYIRYGMVPQAAGLLYGVKPVIIAVVLQALWNLGRTALKTSLMTIVAAAATVLAFLGVHELMLLFASGMVVAGIRKADPTFPRTSGTPLLASLPFVPAVGTSGVLAAASVATTATGFGLAPLFFFFLKVGSVLFGSGYVLLAFLRADLVDRWHWLTEGQLMDAIAVGQITPGPLFTTATFIGYLLAGIPGAGLATLGIFLPAFVFVALSGPLIPRMRRSPVVGSFLDGVNAASLALMTVVSWHLMSVAICDVPTLVLALASGVLLVRCRVNSAWLVLGGALLGMGWKCCFP